MFHATLNARGVVNRTAISEVDNNRTNLLNKHPNVGSFMNNYKVTDILENKLKSIADEVDVEWNDEEYSKSKDLIFIQLKALIARDLYDSSAFYRIINEENDIYIEGLKVILDDEKYYELLKGESDKS
jgi:carboxyl-terminal processing protease